MIRHQMSFLDPALLPSRQIVKHLAQMPFYFAEEQLLAILVVLALPSRVIKMIELCFHHGLLEVLGGSPRRLHDFIPAAVKLPVFAPP